MGLKILGHKRLKCAAAYRSVGFYCLLIGIELSPLECKICQIGAHFRLILEEAPLILAVLLDLIERRLRNIHIPVFKKFRHLTVEQREKQCTDMRTIHVRIGHDDDAVIA